MVLGKLPVPGRPTIWITVGQGPTALAEGAGGGCLDIFTLIYPFSFLSPSLWETTRYRLKYCLKGSLSPKTTNNQPKMTMLVPYRATSSQKVDEPFYDFKMLTIAYFDMCHSEIGETEIIDAYGIRKNVCVCVRGAGAGYVVILRELSFNFT